MKTKLNISLALVSTLALCALPTKAEWTNWHADAYPTETVWALPTGAIHTAHLWCRTNTIHYTNWLSATQSVVIRTNVTYDCRIDRVPWDANLPLSRTVTVSGLTRYTTNGTPYFTNHVMLLSSTLTQLQCSVQARDVWCIDTYRAWKERAAAVDKEWWEPINNPIVDEPPLFIYTQNREHLMWLKTAISALATNYVNTNALNGLQQAAITNVPMWTETGMVAAANAPASYMAATDYAMLNTGSNGWRYARALLSLLTVTKSVWLNDQYDWANELHIKEGLASGGSLDNGWLAGVCDYLICNDGSNAVRRWIQYSTSWNYSSRSDKETDALPEYQEWWSGKTNVGEFCASDSVWLHNIMYWHAANDYEDGNVVVISNYYPQAYAYQRRSLDEENIGEYVAVNGAWPIGTYETTNIYAWTEAAGGLSHWDTNYPNYLQAPAVNDLTYSNLIQCYDAWTNSQGRYFEYSQCVTNFISGTEGPACWWVFTIEPLTLWHWGTTNAFRYR